MKRLWTPALFGVAFLVLITGVALVSGDSDRFIPIIVGIVVVGCLGPCSHFEILHSHPPFHLVQDDVSSKSSRIGKIWPLSKY